MNKRDFIVQGGSALLSGATMSTTWAAPAAGSSATPTARSPFANAQADWQALLGQDFHSQTTLGRPVTLTLRAVNGKAAGTAAHGMTQFTVSFQGPRALPLKPGLHQLTPPHDGSMQLYLEPVHLGERIQYDAHFSLLG